MAHKTREVRCSRENFNFLALFSVNLTRKKFLLFCYIKANFLHKVEERVVEGGRMEIDGLFSSFPLKNEKCLHVLLYTLCSPVRYMFKWNK